MSQVELAYSWRKVMLPLAAAGYHVIAPDQRGYGRTTGWDDSLSGVTIGDHLAQPSPAQAMAAYGQSGSYAA